MSAYFDDSEPSSIFFITFFQVLLVILLSAGLILDIKEIVLFALLLLSSGFISFLWSRASLYRVDFTCTSGGMKIFPGDILKISFKIRNSKLLPVRVKLSFYLPGSIMTETAGTEGSFENETEKNFLSFQESTCTIALRPSARGVYSVGPPVLTGSDIFGLSHKSRLAGLSERQEIIVYPREAKIRNMELPERDYFGSRASRVSPVSDPLYIQGTRDYQRGMPARNIHWKASARHDRLQEKVFDSVNREKVLIILDAGSFGGNEDSSCSFETALEIITAIIMKLARQGKSAGLVTNGKLAGGGMKIIPVSGSRIETSIMLETLARVQMISENSIADIFKTGSYLPYGISCLYFAGSTRHIQNIFSGRKIPCTFILPQKCGDNSAFKNLLYFENIILYEAETP